MALYILVFHSAGHLVETVEQEFLNDLDAARTLAELCENDLLAGRTLVACVKKNSIHETWMRDDVLRKS